MRRTTAVVAALVLVVSLGVGVFVGRTAGGGSSSGKVAALATVSPAATAVGTPVRTLGTPLTLSPAPNVATPSPAATPSSMVATPAATPAGSLDAAPSSSPLAVPTSQALPNPPTAATQVATATPRPQLPGDDGTGGAASRKLGE